MVVEKAFSTRRMDQSDEARCTSANYDRLRPGFLIEGLNVAGKKLKFAMILVSRSKKRSRRS